MRRDARGRAWETYFVTTARLTNAIEAELKAECHVTQPEYNVLLQVARAGDEGIRPSALAHEVVFSPSRLTHTVNRLVSRGYVERTTCVGDGRGGLILMTDAGKKFFEKAANVHREVVREIVLNDLSVEEVTVLNEVFGRIAQRIDDHMA
ncbi:MAG: MarR family transcriptional regulator [Schaalia turicensis]|nr:MarR family transcriptional regulator [Schaalia turicensis]